MVTIVAVQPGSIAEELELQPGDRLLAINGHPLQDLLDFMQLTKAADELVLEVQRHDGELWELELEKDREEDLGIDLEHPDPTQCGNNCLFCFVHQLPPGMRRSLYVKDEDYRFSYLYGAYVTLSNIREEEIERIIRQQLSPLYISVHATDSQLRGRLLGRQALPSILDLLQRLLAAGIELHTQIVVCPGINDGEDLEHTIADLGSLSPPLRSLALVPVGLTGYRSRLPQLRPHTPVEAAQVLATVRRWQQQFLQRFDRRLLFAADEFYLQAGQSLPSLEEYEDFPQLENGVGMIARFRAEAEEVLLEAEPLRCPPVALCTGLSFVAELTAFATRLAQRTGVAIAVHGIANSFFGGQVTVTGLLTGADLLAALRERLKGEVLLLPDVLLRDGEAVLLDDQTPASLSERLGVKIKVIEATPWGVLQALEELAAEGE